MKFGCVFPTVEIGSDPGVIREFAQTAEGLGYTHIVAYDHVVGAQHSDREPKLWGPYDETHPFHEPMVLLAYLAGVTTTIDFMTGVLISPQRQSVLVAKQAAELAILSDNRFRLGVGTGWNFVEYEALNMSFEDRGRMLDEQVHVWRQLWENDLVDFTGDFHRLDRVNALPRPSQTVPVWFGGGGGPAVRRAAELGDGFVFGSTAERTQDACRDLVERLEANGRREGFGIDTLVGFGDGPDAWHKAVAAWEPIGADTLSMRAMTASSKLVGEAGVGFTTAQQHIDALEIFMQEMSND